MNIVVTGTSSGIGHGLAHAYLNQGNSVWGISRRKPDDLMANTQYRHLSLDLTSAGELAQKLPGFLRGIQDIDLLVLNSGILGKIGRMSETSVAEMKEVLEINVWANKSLLDNLFRLGIQIKQVVGMSSKSSLRSTPGWGPYALSKAGLNMLMNIYAKEYPDTHFAAFAPGLVDSEIQDHLYRIKETDKYPAAKKMQEARYTDLMPDPATAAPRLIKGFQKALKYESGSFVDVREM